MDGIWLCRNQPREFAAYSNGKHSANAHSKELLRAGYCCRSWTTSVAVGLIRTYSYIRFSVVPHGAVEGGMDIFEFGCRCGVGCRKQCRNRTCGLEDSGSIRQSPFEQETICFTCPHPCSVVWDHSPH